MHEHSLYVFVYMLIEMPLKRSFSERHELTIKKNNINFAVLEVNWEYLELTAQPGQHGQRS